MTRPIHSKSENLKYFDDDLIKHGVLPVQLFIANKSCENSVLFNPDEIILNDDNGNTYSAMQIHEVVDKVKKTYLRSAGFYIIFGLVGLIPSLVNVSQTNDKIESFYADKAIRGGTVVKGAVTEGWVFFRVSPSIKSLDGYRIGVFANDIVKDDKILIEQRLRGDVIPRRCTRKNRLDSTGENVTELNENPE